jgi:hypothetical protein
MVLITYHFKSDSVGEVTAVNLQSHGGAYLQRYVLGPSDLRTSYMRPLFHAFLTYPTESIVTRFVRWTHDDSDEGVRTESHARGSPEDMFGPHDAHASERPRAWEHPYRRQAQQD